MLRLKLKIKQKAGKTSRKEKQEMLYDSVLKDEFERRTKQEDHGKKNLEMREPIRVAEMKPGYFYFTPFGDLIHCLARNPNLWPDHTFVTWDLKEDADTSTTHLFNEWTVYKKDNNFKTPKLSYLSPQRIAGPVYIPKLVIGRNGLYIKHEIKKEVLSSRPILKFKGVAGPENLRHGFIIPSLNLNKGIEMKAKAKAKPKAEVASAKAKPAGEKKVSKMMAIISCLKRGILKKESLLAEVKRMAGSAPAMPNVFQVVYRYNNGWYADRGIPAPSHPAVLEGQRKPVIKGMPNGNAKLKAKAVPVKAKPSAEKKAKPKASQRSASQPSPAVSTAPKAKPRFTVPSN